MSVACDLRESVRRAYSEAAEHPQNKHAFPVGHRFALSLGYSEDWLDTLPAVCIEGFSGVSNVSSFADIREGDSVLDLGCGAGLDSLIAARRAGTGGKVYGVDFSDAMLRRARQAASQAGAPNIEFLRGDAEYLPLGDATIDVAIVNGIFNLNPARKTIFSELARVVRPGGVVHAAELVLKAPLPERERLSEANWFA
jgi:arsenite methyltransferase